MSIQHRIQVVSSGFVLGLALVLISPVANAQACGGQLIDETLPSGSRWEVCVEERAEEGVVVSDAYFSTPAGLRRKVLKEASLAQIHVTYDDGSAARNLVTDLAAGYGLGGSNLQPLTSAECPTGTLIQSGGNNVICQQVLERGYAYKSYSVLQQGHLLSVTSMSTAGPHTYIVRWRFFDDGTLEPSVGLTGTLPIISNDPRYGWLLDDLGRVAVGFTNTYFWRIDFDLGSVATDEVVERFELIPSADRSRKSITKAVLATEAGEIVNPDLKRSWRIRDESIFNTDGRAVSYHLEPLHAANRPDVSATLPAAASDIAFTAYDACERFPNQNPTTGGCGGALTDFVDGDSLNSADIVIWYNTSYHHLPKSEDEPGIPIHWDGVVIVPRDWTSSNPLSAIGLDLTRQFAQVSAVVGGQS